MATAKPATAIRLPVAALPPFFFHPMDATNILTPEEVQAVLKDLHRRKFHYLNPWQNLIIFRLACCCGLRAKEISRLQLGDLIVSGARPCIRIRKDATKATIGMGLGVKRKGKARMVPLWWDSGTLEDLRLWREFRLEMSQLDGRFVISLKHDRFGDPLTEDVIARRWKTAIHCLGEERVSQLSVHCGRHSFISHALFRGRSLIEVRDAAGHSTIDTTSRYAHLLESDHVGDLFSFKESE